MIALTDDLNRNMEHEIRSWLFHAIILLASIEDLI